MYFCITTEDKQNEKNLFVDGLEQLAEGSGADEGGELHAPVVIDDDAVRAAPILDVVLTRRAGYPMCGVPYHAVESYLPKLLDAGVKVAIAEQMEDPKLA